MRWHQPISDQPNALSLHPNFSQSAGYFPLSGHTYNSDYQYQANADIWNNDTASNASPFGAPFLHAALQ
jgi:hypothetical protein